MYKKPLRGMLAALFLGCIFYAHSAFGAEPAHFAALHLDRFPKPLDLPDISLSDLNGKNVALRSFEGRVVLLNFWTTW